MFNFNNSIIIMIIFYYITYSVLFLIVANIVFKKNFLYKSSLFNFKSTKIVASLFLLAIAGVPPFWLFFVKFHIFATICKYKMMATSLLLIFFLNNIFFLAVLFKIYKTNFATNYSFSMYTKTDKQSSTYNKYFTVFFLFCQVFFCITGPYLSGFMFM